MTDGIRPQTQAERAMRTCGKILVHTAVLPYHAGEYLWTKAHGKLSQYFAKKQNEKRKLQMVRSLVPPTITKRPRSLSLTYGPVATAARPLLRSKQQDECLLLRLPYELRIAIFEEVIGHQDFHVILRADKLHTFRCHVGKHKTINTTEIDGSVQTHPGTIFQNAHSSCWTGKTYGKISMKDGKISWKPLASSHVDVLPLMQTCRRMSVPTNTITKVPTYIH